MAYDPGAIDAALAAAVGDDPLLIAELRVAFLDGVARALAAMTEAGDAPAWCEAAWCEAAWRLHALAASFGATGLMRIAAEAANGEPGDAHAMRALHDAMARL